MAQRRMFSPKIVTSDAFTDMPMSSQALYFHLGMQADDDGFVNPRGVIRMSGAADDDLKVLIGKRFVLPFDNGVIVIKHWRINNLIKNDRYTPTIYQEQKNLLDTKDNGAYTERFQNGSKMVPQVRLGKVRLEKDSVADAPEIFSFEGKFHLMKNSKNPATKITALYWFYKGWKFDNKAQYEKALKRELIPANALKGYTIEQIGAAMDFCSKEYKVWTLETCHKRVDDLVNKK